MCTDRDKDWGVVGRGVAVLTLTALVSCGGASSGESAAAVASGSASTVTPTGAFGIQVKGNRFVSAKDGSPVQIVGTNISGLETGRNSRWPQFAEANSAFWSKVVNYGGWRPHTRRRTQA